MKKQYRAEISALTKTKKKIIRDHYHHTQVIVREIDRRRKAIKKADVASGRELVKINRRIAILEGRLS